MKVIKKQPMMESLFIENIDTDTHIKIIEIVNKYNIPIEIATYKDCFSFFNGNDNFELVCDAIKNNYIIFEKHDNGYWDINRYSIKEYQDIFVEMGENENE